ncbi:MAG: helix-turn-helix domain-containing protein [Solirubrobacteraceae bacterium]
MPIEDNGVVSPGPMQWQGRTSPRSARSSPLYAYLLDADAELADQFDVRGRIAARQLATARVLHVPVGESDLAPWFETARGAPGLLILDGVLVFETRTGSRVAAELLGAGDLLQSTDLLADDLLERSCTWRVLRPARLALLDGDFCDRVRPFPQIIGLLLERSCQRIAELDALRAIASQPKLEVRLVLLLWHLAARWGRVEPASVRLCLPLTHRLLGQLVAAERPSISHALKRLAHAGLITGTADDLHLHGSIDDQLDLLSERPQPLVEHPVSGDRHAG